jgi:hypothetical protein
VGGKWQEKRPQGRLSTFWGATFFDHGKWWLMAAGMQANQPFSTAYHEELVAESGNDNVEVKYGLFHYLLFSFPLYFLLIIF